MSPSPRKPKPTAEPDVKTHDLTVAVTGPTGTFGFGLMPFLQSDQRVARIVGIARRPFDPGEHGWNKMEYRQGDVRDQSALEDAFKGADVVVHLAFMITGNAPRDTIRAINVEGTMNTFRAAAAAGVQRFVYASSIAAYGFHPDNPVGMTEDWPVRPADKLFYAKEKAEIEGLLAEASAGHPDVDLYLLRPPIVLGPHTVGAKDVLPGPFAPLGRLLAGALGNLPVPALPAVAPTLPIQFIHEEDVGRAFQKCVVAAGPPGAYNIAADDVLTAVEVVRELGLRPVPIPGAIVQTAARAVAALPIIPPVLEWVEAATHPAVMDTSKAKRELDWAPRHSAREAIRETVRNGA